MATQKQVTIIARYQNKKTGVVSYLVRSSDGKTEYCTTLIEGKASGCSCPSYKPCYHMKGLENREAARPFAAKSLPVWAIELVKTGKLVAPGKKAAPVAPKVATIIKQAVTAKVPARTDISTKGNLNGQRGFSILR